MIPFKTQFDKLTSAYINGEVDPFDCSACFVGNLLNNDYRWSAIREYERAGRSKLRTTSAYSCIGRRSLARESSGMYTSKEILRIENLFLKILNQETFGIWSFFLSSFSYEKEVKKHRNYENALFKAFSATLDLLKEIHESKGEKVDDFIFTKRPAPVQA